MAHTYREADAICEVVVSCQDFPDHTNGLKERAKFLDVICARRPVGYCGTKERADFMWILVEMPPDLIPMLNEPVIEGGVINDKKRYCIPAHRLLGVINETRARDSGDEYQPFVVVDDDLGEFLSTSRPIRYEGLIFDKQTGRYLG